MEYNELMHYGVLGMKWGIKHDPTKAYHKAINKSNKLQKKIDSNDLRAERYQAKSSIAENKAFLNRTKKRYGKSNIKKAYKHEYESEILGLKADKATRKSIKLERKREKWLKKVEDNFSKYEVTRIPDEEYKVGLHYVDAYNVTPLSEVKKKVG